MKYSWENKIVLITGGATGIGALVTRNLMKEKAKHVAFLDIQEKPGLELQTELNSKYGNNKVKFYKVDVTNEDMLLGAFDAVVAEQGYLDVVINNAGIMNDSLNIYRKEIQVNVTALVNGTLKALDIMGKDKGGKGGAIINIASVAGLSRSPMLPIYYGTKSFVLQFSNCLGLNEYYSLTGVRVVTMCFGATSTPMVHNTGNFKEAIQGCFPEHLKKFPMQKPENAAQGVIDAFKSGENGSTWISTSERPVKEITDTINKVYDLLATHVFQ